MKNLLIEAKQYLNNCMSSENHHNNDNHHNNYRDNSSNSNNNIYNNSNDNDRTHEVIEDRKQNVYNPTSTIQSPITATTFYETLQRPFKPDQLRGRWSSSIDFYFACTSHAFGTIMFSEVPAYAFLLGGIYLLPAYLIAILLYAIPIFIIQTFLGQFSSSGIISALRVAPIFKGIGYSILVLNLTSLAYYGVIAAMPLIYAANSLHAVIPWMSCDNTWNTHNCSTHETYDAEEEFLYPHATVEFFRHVIRSSYADSSEFSVSWPILCGVVGVWLCAAALLIQKISFVGKFLRCLCIVMLSCFVAIFCNLIIHHEVTWSSFSAFFDPILGHNETTILSSMRGAIFMTTWVLGPGYGSVLTIASYNNFRRSSDKLTYWVCATHVILVLCAILCGRIALDHFEDHVGMFHLHFDEDHFLQFLYLCFSYLFGSFTSLPSFWSFLFFAMLFFAELSAVIIQARTVLTGLFDEYEKLRGKKIQVTIALCLTMLLISIYFCTKQGFQHLHVLPNITVLTQLVISMVLIMMTVWVYGRERFQCDLQFMLGKTISSFKIFLIRFMTPIFLIICMFQVLFILYNDSDPPESLIIIIQCIIYIFAPGYMIYKVCRTNGSFRNRLKQCFMPHDWYPVDSDNRHFYEEIMGISEMLVFEHEQQQFVNSA